MYPPPQDFQNRAKVRSREEYEELYERSISSKEEFWGRQANALQWFHPHTTVLETDGQGEFAWFGGGRLNAAVNCVDRHASKTPDKAAFRWLRQPSGEFETITYLELKHRMGRMANLLKEKGVKRGDCVCLYMPMIPELAVAMLACSRIGAVHVVVHAGYSAETLRERLQDTKAKVLLTAAELSLLGRRQCLKRRVDQAVVGLADLVCVLVARNQRGATPSMTLGRDEWLDDGCARHRVTCSAEWMPSEESLFVLHSSGTSGEPKGLVYATAGYMLQVYLSHRYLFDVREDDVHLCTSDLGWIVGHSYALYGPLLNGITSVCLEDPLSPNVLCSLGEVIDQAGVTTLYTTPFVLRQLQHHASASLEQASLDTLRLIGTVGETTQTELWEWCYRVLGRERCPVVDTWWQPETGSVLLAPLPGAWTLKPGAVAAPFFGVEPVLIDEDGSEIEHNNQEGTLCFRNVWPGLARTILNDHQCYLDTYFRRCSGLFCTHDRSCRDSDGYYRITGRDDDIFHVNGHRVHAREIERALLSHEAVSEAIVASYPHEDKTQGVCAWVLPEAHSQWPMEELAGALKEQVRQRIGSHLAPDVVLVSSEESLDAVGPTQRHKVRSQLMQRMRTNPRV